MNPRAAAPARAGAGSPRAPTRRAENDRGPSGTPPRSAASHRRRSPRPGRGWTRRDRPGYGRMKTSRSRRTRSGARSWRKSAIDGSVFATRMGRPAASRESARNSSADESAGLDASTPCQYARSSRGSAARRARTRSRTVAGVSRTTKCLAASRHVVAARSERVRIGKPALAFAVTRRSQ